MKVKMTLNMFRRHALYYHLQNLQNMHLLDGKIIVQIIRVLR